MLNGRTLVLGVAAAVAVSLAVVVTVDKHTTSKSHDAVAAYIIDVNAAQAAMAGNLTLAALAYRSFSTNGKVGPAQRQKLQEAKRTLIRLQTRMAGVPVPRQAHRLRALLLELGRAEIVVADEVVRIAEFAPAFGRVVTRAQAARVRLRDALAAVHQPKPRALRGPKKKVLREQRAFTAAARAAASTQADAVEAYVAALAPLERQLRKVVAPPVLAPARQTELEVFHASRTTGAALAAELRRADRTRVPALSRAFTVAARRAGSVAAQQAQVDAVKAYNARVARIAALRARISRELARLQSLTG